MEENGTLEIKIVEAARNLFTERGYERTSMSDIAAAAGINRTTLHYYFRTKDKMFRAVFGSIVEAVLPRMKVIFDEEIPLMDKFSKVIDEYFRIFSENPSLPRFILDEINRDVNQFLDTAREMKMDLYLSSIEQVVRREMERGTIRSIPSPTVLMTFISQLTFPFLARNLVTGLFYQGEGEYESFLQEWKRNILAQMGALLG